MSAVPPATDVQLVLAVVRQMDPASTFDEILVRLDLLAALRKAKADVVAARLIPHEEVARRIDEWVRKDNLR